MITHTWAPRHVWCAPRGRNGLGAWRDLSPPRTGTRAPKPCAMSQLRKPWAQCHGLMGHYIAADSHPWFLCTTQGHNVLWIKRDQPWAQCHGSLLWSWNWTWQYKQATSPGHGYLDMAWAHKSVWGRHTNAPDTWSVGWCMLPGSEGLCETKVWLILILMITKQGLELMIIFQVWLGKTISKMAITKTNQVKEKSWRRRPPQKEEFFKTKAS